MYTQPHPSLNVQFPWWPLTPSPLCINPQHSTGITTILYWNHKYAHSLNMSSSRHKTQVGNMGCLTRLHCSPNRSQSQSWGHNFHFLLVDSHSQLHHSYKYISQHKTCSVDIATKTICQWTQFPWVCILFKCFTICCQSRPHRFSLENKNECVCKLSFLAIAQYHNLYDHIIHIAPEQKTRRQLSPVH